MFKLFLHPTEVWHPDRKTKSNPLLMKYLVNSPIINKEFFKDETTLQWLDQSKDKDNPDLLVKKKKNVYSDKEFHIGYDWVDYCAFEFKFGMDLVSSLNSGLLEDELTRMKLKYSEIYCYGDPLPKEKYEGLSEKEKTYCIFSPMIPLYLVIVNEDMGKDKPIFEGVIDCIDLARAVTKAQNLNIRVKYCNTPDTFAENVFDLIRTPPKEVDLGQRFVKKSSGSEWNCALQEYRYVSKDVANNTEEIYDNMEEFIWAKREANDEFMHYMEECFTTESGRFMKKNMEKFLRKVSGK